LRRSERSRPPRLSLLAATFPEAFLRLHGPNQGRALLSQRSVRFCCLRYTGSCRRTGIPRLESVDSPGNIPVQAIVPVLIDHTIAVDIRSRFDARLVKLRVYLGIAEDVLNPLAMIGLGMPLGLQPLRNCADSRLLHRFHLAWLGPRVFGAIRSMLRHVGDMGLARQHSCKASLFGRIVPGLFSFDQHKFPTT
jgi:hypothetical protein